MNKNCFFRRGIGVLLSVLLTAACVPVAALGEDGAQEADFSGTNLMDLERVQPSGFSSTTNPYGYDVGMPVPHGGAERADVSECLGKSGPPGLLF